MLVTTEKQFFGMIEAMSKDDQFIMIDTETEGLDPYVAKHRICGVPVYLPQQNKSYYAPFRHKQGKNLNPKLIQELAKPLNNKKSANGMYNAPFDINMLRADGVTFDQPIWDAQFGWFLANENESSYKMEKIAEKYIDKNAGDAERELLEKVGGDKGRLHELPAKDVARYAEQDVKTTWNIMDIASAALTEDGMIDLWEGCSDFYQAVAEIEWNGLGIHREAVETSLVQHLWEQDQLLAEIRAECGNPLFNPNSWQQVVKLLGTPNAQAETLDALEDPMGKKMALCRKYTKLIGSYWEPMIRMADENDRVHAALMLIVVITGRLSCRGLNLQALPRPGEGLLGVVRDYIVPHPKNEGWKIAAPDLNQAELRLLTHYTQDPMFVDAYKSGRNVHQEVADALGLDYDTAKRMNLGMVYGMGAPGLSTKAKVPLSTATQMLKQYHHKYPGVRKLQDKCEQEAIETGEIVMWSGRRRRYPRHYDTRKAMSNKIQGGIGEVLRVGKGRVWRKIDRTKAKMLMQVHDELVFEVHPDYDEELRHIVTEQLTDFPFDVPLKVEYKSGGSWTEAKSK